MIKTQLLEASTYPSLSTPWPSPLQIKYCKFLRLVLQSPPRSVDPPLNTHKFSTPPLMTVPERAM